MRLRLNIISFFVKKNNSLLVLFSPMMVHIFDFITYFKLRHAKREIVCADILIVSSKYEYCCCQSNVYSLFPQFCDIDNILFHGTSQCLTVLAFFFLSFYR